MPPQRYEAVRGNSTLNYLTVAAIDVHLKINAQDDDDFDSPITPSNDDRVPSSPPPSFRSRDSSLSSRRLLAQDPISNNADQDLADTFDDGEGSDTENDGDDRQRLMRGEPGTPRANGSDTQSTPNTAQPQPRVERRVTELPAFRPTGRVQPQAPATDGVFANLSAKLERGEQLDEKPPVCTPSTLSVSVTHAV